ncbi:hypothetical protein THARTR1_04271 [Trichoderma harzianum]|uniref:Mid2 domain-containing protein n=1 Tax=Trichoderma harzianum TaxID=5544 RepID=A0A2K0UCD9_TRIHA|nr:hypothetical protein THARTR1_04271 [Trichoderma harzianum]
MIVAPPPRSSTLTALAVSSTLLQIASSHALPRETKTVAVRELNVAPWPIAPTPAPRSPFLRSMPEHLLPRDFNTVCGYIGGNPGFPATCLAGSHCAVDVENKAIGCCPDGAPCTEGIFTGCVDVNSPPQTELNPYVFTCTGADVCYQNHFDGGFFQFGCGADSHLATTVATTAVSRSPLDFSHVSFQLTATPTLLSEPTTIGSRTGTESTSKTTSRATKTKTKGTSDASETDTATSSDSASTGTSTSTSTSTPDPAAPTSSGSSKAGPIAGGVIGGLAGLALLAGLIFYFLRKRRAAAPTQYITPSTEKYDNFDPRTYPPNTALLTEERGIHGDEAELTPITPRPSQPAPQLGELGLAVPLDPGYGRPSDEIPLTESAPKPSFVPPPLDPEPEDDRPYNPRRRGDGDGASFWSQTRSESRSRGRPWV